METRIKMGDTLTQTVMKMTDGNPGAAQAMIMMLNCNAKIDPESALGQFSGMVSLDSFGIFGTDIYVLWSDICGKDMPKMLAVLRSVQLGFFTREVLRDACSRQDYSGREMVPVEELYEKVYNYLDKFNRE